MTAKSLSTRAPAHRGAQQIVLQAAHRIDAMRAFNRFYTRRTGLLEEGLLKSDFSLTEVRVLYELAHAETLNASDLARELKLDMGYMSRILKRLHARALLQRSASKTDKRQSVLSLTTKGRKAFVPIEKATREQVAAMLDVVPADGKDKLLQSMQTIQRLLGERSETHTPFAIRDPRPGDIGWIVHRHGVLYAAEYGWDESFEGLVAEIAGTFIRTFDPKREHCWIAEREGEVVGSVFLVRKSERVAQLRLLYVEPSTRGLGIGRRLVDECIAFANAKGYKTMTLWTNDVLASARKIYQAAGFELVKEERHYSFGKGLVGQNWDLKLQGADHKR